VGQTHTVIDTMQKHRKDRIPAPKRSCVAHNFATFKWEEQHLFNNV